MAGREAWAEYDLERALHALEEGRIEAAEAELREIAAADPGTLGGLAWAYLGRIAMARWDVEGAREALDRALGQAPDHYVVRLERGVFFLRLGLYPQAIPELERAFRAAPNRPAREHAARLLQRAWERSRGSFIRHARLPDLSPLRRIFRKRGSEGAPCSSERC